eukprot:scaffold25099_cov76-Amphora_coffeaeformis.AAC.1
MILLNSEGAIVAFSIPLGLAVVTLASTMVTFCGGTKSYAMVGAAVGAGVGGGVKRSTDADTLDDELPDVMA